MMRRVLVDHARKHHRLKRGGPIPKVSLDEAFLFSESQVPALLAVDESVTRLSQRDPRMGQIVELRFFGGLSVEETAHTLNISAKTVKRDWSVARAWLYSDLKERYAINPSAVERSQKPL